MFKILRSIPRVSSRLFTEQKYVSSLMPLQRQTFGITGVGNIHTTFSRYSVKDELVHAIDAEIKAEKQLEQDNLGGSSPPTIQGFAIKKNEAEVTLSKTFGNEKINVIFNVNHTVDLPQEYDGEQEATEGGEDEPTNIPESLPSFNVTISKGDQRLCFELKLVSSEDGQYDFLVEEFYITSGEFGQDVKDHVYASSGEFIDPTLHELLFVRYLEERGFTAEFCQSLASFATHYEHSQYVNLIKKIKDFVSN